MGARKIPDDAYDFYFGLGPNRSYEAVAQKFGVTKRAITSIAKREDWQGRIRVVEAKAREAADQKATETLTAMRQKHLKMLEVIQAKALQALKTMPIDTAYQAVRALATAIEQERVIRGEPSERIDVATIIKTQFEKLALRPGEQDDWSDLERPAG